mgnify:CR=1 FL=1
MEPADESGKSNPGAQPLHAAMSALAGVSSASIGSLAPVAARLLGAEACQILIADYALRSLRSLEVDGSQGASIEVEGTMAGRAFASGEVVVQGDGPTTMWVPLSDGTERIGVLESRFGDAREPSEFSSDVVDLIVLAIVSRRRYTDVVAFARRSQRLSEAAEAQWDLLPPLAHEVPGASVSGAVEPAYDIGGDSFEAALAAHQTKLEAEVGQLHGAIDGVRRLRARLAAGERPFGHEQECLELPDTHLRRPGSRSVHASTVSTVSHGRQTGMLGMSRRLATCSTGWCVGPSSPRPIESCV